MHFWRESFFQSLKEIAAEAKDVPEWADYARYCEDQERGLRRQAFIVLERFLCRMESVTFVERRRFVSWLLHRADGRDGEHMLIPQPLRKRLVEPTCAEWIQLEPASSEPHRWLGTYPHLKLALQLNPTDEIAARKFINLILGSTQYATHELPAGYLGDPHEDLKSLDEAEASLSALCNDAERSRCAAEIATDRNSIQRHLDGKRES